MYCSKPNIIVNKSIYRYMSFGRKMVYTDGTSIYNLYQKIPSPKFVGATTENYKNWNLLTEDGELIPLFIAVPCGKCLLCTEKRAMEWTTRAICETASCEFPPVFVTLTYKDAKLPSDGVMKEDVQKFLKRFRINWLRMYGHQLNLRYFACAEYGSKYGRPHYHLQMWNLPHKSADDLLSLQKIEACIKKSWSEPCDEKELFAEEIFNRFTWQGKHYRLFGKIDCSFDEGNSSAYCMKYMRKPKDVPQQWKNPTFYLSSRRGGGIGCPFLEKQLCAFRRAPQSTTITIPTGHSCVEHGLPRCFKDKIYPSLSCVISAHVRYTIERYEGLYNSLIKYAANCEHHFELITAQRDSIRTQYGRCYDYIVQSGQLFGDPLHKVKKGYLNYHDLNDIFRQMTVCYIQLYDYQPNKATIESFIDLKDKRKDLLSKVTFKEIDVEAEEYRIKQRRFNAHIKEKF